MKTFVEKLLEICNKLNIDDVNVTYDKVHNASITFNAPHTRSYIEICERDFDDDLMVACDAEKIYEVYRNENCVFIGNDMYDMMFYELLEYMLKTVVGYDK